MGASIAILRCKIAKREYANDVVFPFTREPKGKTWATANGLSAVELREMGSLKSLECEYPIIDSDFQNFCASHGIFSGPLSGFPIISFSFPREKTNSISINSLLYS